MLREPTLQEFLTDLHMAFNDAKPSPDVTRVVSHLFEALEKPGQVGATNSTRLPVCRHLPAAISFASRSTASIAALAKAFAKIETRLNWMVRPAAGPNASANWPQGHANAMIVGPKGLEKRSDIAIGVSLLGTEVRYPDHNHGPEEIYLVLTPGTFQHGTSDWFEPGPGGTLHNVPNVRHAMASGTDPLLAIWCLLLSPDGDVKTQGLE